MPNLETRSSVVDPEADRIRDLCSAFLALQVQARSNQVLRDEIAAMKASHSWRLTAPLRQLRRWLGFCTVMVTGFVAAFPYAIKSPVKTGNLMSHQW